MTSIIAAKIRRQEMCLRQKLIVAKSQRQRDLEIWTINPPLRCKAAEKRTSRWTASQIPGSRMARKSVSKFKKWTNNCIGHRLTRLCFMSVQQLHTATGSMDQNNKLYFQELLNRQGLNGEYFLVPPAIDTVRAESYLRIRVRHMHKHMLPRLHQRYNDDNRSAVFVGS